jgi:hypothetical protein
MDYTQQQFNQKDTIFCKGYQGDYGPEIINYGRKTI